MTTELHPSYLIKDGQKQFVVLPYEEFIALQEELTNALDLIDLEEARAENGNDPGIPYEEMRRRLGLLAVPDVQTPELPPLREAQQ